MTEYIIKVPDNLQWVQSICLSTVDGHAYFDAKSPEDLTLFRDAEKAAYDRGYQAAKLDCDDCLDHMLKHKAKDEEIKKEAREKGYRDGYDYAKNEDAETLERLGKEVRKVEEEKVAAYKEGFAAGKKESAEHSDCHKCGHVYSAYREGLDVAWGAAKTIITEMDLPTRRKLFKTISLEDIFEENAAAEALEEIRALDEMRRQEEEKKQEEKIKFGDEVEYSCDNEKVRFIATEKEGSRWYGFTINADDEGDHNQYCDEDELVKTGRNFADVLRQMQEES